jgi:Cu+-exporting ATPase
MRMVLAAGLALGILWAAAAATAVGPKMAILEVKGMVCPACPIGIERTLERLPGVRRAEASRERNEAKVVYEPDKIAPEKFVETIGKIGFEARLLTITDPPRPTLKVEGITDLKTVYKVRDTLLAVPGVKKITIDPKFGEVFVESDGGAVPTDRLIAALAKAGFRAQAAN